MNVCSSIVSGLWGMRLGEGNGIGRPFKDKTQRTVSLLVRKPSPHMPVAVGGIQAWQVKCCAGWMYRILIRTVASRGLCPVPSLCVLQLFLPQTRGYISSWSYGRVCTCVGRLSSQDGVCQPPSQSCCFPGCQTIHCLFSSISSHDLD